MGQHQVLIGQQNPKHRPGQDIPDGPFQLNGLLRIHSIFDILSYKFCEQRGAHLNERRLRNHSGSTGDCPQRNGYHHRHRRRAEGALRAGGLR